VQEEEQKEQEVRLEVAGVEVAKLKTTVTAASVLLVTVALAEPAAATVDFHWHVENNAEQPVTFTTMVTNKGQEWWGVDPIARNGNCWVEGWHDYRFGKETTLAPKEARENCHFTSNTNRIVPGSYFTTGLLMRGDFQHEDGSVEPFTAHGTTWTNSYETGASRISGPMEVWYTRVTSQLYDVKWILKGDQFQKILDLYVTTVSENRDKCTITGTEGDDVIEGTDGEDVICGLGGNDIINAGDGNDIVYGGPGDDVIDAGDGDDIVGAGAGNDIVNGGSGDDYLKGATGEDLLIGGDGDDHLVGNSGDDALIVGEDAEMRIMVNDSTVASDASMVSSVEDSDGRAATWAKEASANKESSIPVNLPPGCALVDNPTVAYWLDCG